VGRVRELRGRVRVGAPDPTLTGVAGMAAVSELVDRLCVIKLLDAASGRSRPVTAGRPADSCLNPPGVSGGSIC
jgi:hypothetical protein